ncbi:MAG: hypothetical protein HN576_10200 [Bacteriovoracaceae bacterium]|jgi:hypothetical protein|nr:hypothetical protein [Bacteriovoracaceae bacterium]
MKLTTPSKKLSFLVYENSESPKYFELKKSYLKFILMGLPSISFISIMALIFCGIYFKQIREMARRKKPAIIEELRIERDGLALKLKESHILNTKLQHKLTSSAATSAGPGINISTLNLFKKTAGMTDLSAAAKFTVEKIDVIPSGNKIQLYFELVNQTKDNSKIAGYVFVLMKNKGQFFFYPESSTIEDDLQITFNRGESFAMSRLRKVDKAVFPAPKESTTLYFKILIFSRTGDLLYKSTMEKNWKI